MTFSPAPEPRPPRGHAWKIITALVALLVLSPLLLAQWENWRGARAWNEYLAKARAAGEPTTARDLLPTRIPDEQNFAKIPLLRPLTDFELGPPTIEAPFGVVQWHDQAGMARLEKLRPFPMVRTASHLKWWKGDEINFAVWDDAAREASRTKKPSVPEAPGAELQRYLQQFEAAVEELRSGCVRPGCAFLTADNIGPGNELKFALTLRSFCTILRLRAHLQLAKNSADLAARDIVLAIRLGRCAGSAPLMRPTSFASSCVDTVLPPLWEGLCHHRWNDAQLADFDRGLQTFDFVLDFQRALYGERAINTWPLWEMEKSNPAVAIGQAHVPLARVIATLVPAGTIDFNKVTVGELYAQVAQTALPASHRFRLDQARQVEADLRREIAAHPFHPHTLGTRFTGSILFLWLRHAATSQATIDLARCAIALERYRLEHGELPERLEQLAPKFLVAPHDVMTGEPLHYRRHGDGTYLLYSVGTNETDEHGTMEWKPWDRDVPDFDKGDLVWPQPKKP